MINERKLTEKELEKREVALKGLLQNKQSLVKKYGKEAEKVMYGIATKQAKSKVETMNLDKIKETIEGLDIGSKVKIAKEYGGGKGTVEDIKGSFVVVKTKKGNESYHESDLKPVEERIKELIVKSLTKEDNDPSGEYLEGDPDEHVEENISEDKEFSLKETKVISQEVAKAVVIALKEIGNEVTGLKVKKIEPNDFEIFVQYEDESNEPFSFYINEDDTLHLADFSFDKELIDVGVKPSGEAVVNVSELAKKLVDHFKSMKENINEVKFEDNEISAIRKMTRKALELALKEKKKEFKDLKIVDKGESKKEGEYKFRAVFTSPNEEGEDVEKAYNFIVDKGTLYLKDIFTDTELVDIGVNLLGKEGGIDFDKVFKDEDILDVKKLTKELVDYLESQENFDGMDLVPVEEDINDPVLMKMRATDSKPKINPAFKAIKNASKIEMLQNKRAEIMMDMEQEAEPEGGPIADKYGRMLTKVDDAIEKLGGNPMEEDLDIGHEDNEPQMLKAELARAGQMVQMLYRAIDKYDGQGEVDFPQWWQKKIIQANTMLDSAFDYIDGKEKVAQIDAVIDMVDEVTTDKEFAASEEEARLEKHPEKDLINKIKAMMSQEKLKEKLTKKSSVDKHIEDFKDSDAPQFKGKSDKKKIQMAVASFLAKQNK